MSTRMLAGRFDAQTPMDGGVSVPWRTYVLTARHELRCALRVIETRRELQELHGRLLDDVGLTRLQAKREAQRLPWDLAPVLGRMAADLTWSNIVHATFARATAAVPQHSWASHRSIPGDRGPRDGRWPWRNAGQQWTAITHWIADALQRRRSRRAITELDSFLLKDIGVSYADAEHEANKPFWR